MKIEMRKNTRRKTASITFRAQNDHEGVALKNAILAAGAAKGIDNLLPARIAQGLIENGVDRADIDLRVVSPKPRKRASK